VGISFTKASAVSKTPKKEYGIRFVSPFLVFLEISCKHFLVLVADTAGFEFVRVDFENGTEESFGNTVGMLGNFKTGETLARDGVLDDFLELGSEWQVLPLDDMLFHSVEQPQFPKTCLEPEDPRGERRRRLGESSITEEQAEDACSSLKDAADRKDCVYDVLATQDLDIVGAFWLSNDFISIVYYSIP
jgi:hypothetical protein